jgi:hypothetical protein
MFAPRTATGLTLALLALPATATATPTDTSGGGGGGGDAASLSSHYGWGQTTPAQVTPRLVQPNPDQRSQSRTSSLAGTTSPRSFAGPDAADAARAGDVATAMEHYQRSQAATTAAKPTPDNDAPAWPEIAFAGVVLLATAGGVVRVRMRRSPRVAA